MANNEIKINDKVSVKLSDSPDFTATVLKIQISEHDTRYYVQGVRGSALWVSANRIVGMASAPCVYADVPGDPAIRVCSTHNPNYGLYGDEVCSRESA